MKVSMRKNLHLLFFISLVVLLLVLLLIDILVGSVSMPLRKSIAILLHYEVNTNWSYIIWQLRFPRAVTAILAGAGLSVSGLMMQTLFRNPLAGPYVLGISSGASLGVAILVMSAGMLPLGWSVVMYSYWGQVFAAIIGAFIIFLLIVVVASRIRDSVSLLIVGIMIGSVTTAVVSILQYFSSPELVQKFVIWTLGSLSSTGWSQLGVASLFVVPGVLFSFWLIKPLNALLLGDNNAITTGVNIVAIRYCILMATSIITGALTAFTGPIGFIGIAVPHICRLMLRTTNHRVLLPAVILSGAIILLICDIISQVPGHSIVLPVNAITAVFGAPVVLWIILGKRNLKTSF
jgi:iron complex transport system permease protein